MAKSPGGSTQADLTELRYLFAFLARDIKAFNTAKRAIDSAKFDSTQTGLRIIWEQTVLFHARWGKLPTAKELNGAVLGYLDEADIDDDYAELDIEQVVEMASTLTKEKRNARRTKVTQLLRKFLDTATARQIREDLASGGNIDAVLREGQKALTQHKTLEVGRSKDWFASIDQTLAEAKIVVFPTGHALADELTNGGLRGGETLLHLGAVNSGKTTFAVDVVVSRVKYEQLAAKKEKRKPRVLYFYCYEESRQVLAQIIARASNIMSSSVQEFLETGNRGVLSSKERGDYKPYEKRWRKLGKVRPNGELERLEIAYSMLSSGLRFVSMSTEDPANAEYCEAFVDGLYDHFVADLANTNAKPDMVVIDHASAMVDRYMDANNLKVAEKNTILKRTGRSLRDLIAAPYLVPVWCLHQLGSEENKRPPGTVPDVASGADCRMMHEYFSFAIQSSRLIDPEKVGVVALGKKRRMKGVSHIPFQLDGDMCRWIDARSSHVIHGGRVRKREDIAPVSTTANKAFTPSRRL